VVVNVSVEQLVRWAAMATLCDSYMSLVYHRSAIKQWDTSGAPRAEEWSAAMARARRTGDELVDLIMATTGLEREVVQHLVGAEMHRLPWEIQTPMTQHG
jgi:predicted solute-binding protein